MNRFYRWFALATFVPCMLGLLGCGILSELPELMKKVETSDKFQKDAIEKRIDLLLSNARRNHNMVGVAVAVTKDGKTLYRKAHGWSDANEKVPFTTSTLFRWASISKTLTGVATMKLVEKNHINLGKDIRTYLKGYCMLDIDSYWVRGKQKYSGIWLENRDREDCATVRGQTRDQFLSELQKRESENYRLIDIEIYKKGGSWTYASIWKKNTEKLEWLLERGLTSDEFGAAFAKHMSAGMRMIDIEINVTLAGASYTSIWVKRKAGVAWGAYRNMTSEAMAQKFREMTEKGMRIIDIEATLVGNSVRYAAIFLENPKRWKWALFRNLSSSAFGAKYKELQSKGYRILDVETYTNSQKEHMWAGVWVKDGSPLRTRQIRLMSEEQMKGYSFVLEPLPVRYFTNSNARTVSVVIRPRHLLSHRSGIQNYSYRTCSRDSQCPSNECRDNTCVNDEIKFRDLMYFSKSPFQSLTSAAIAKMSPNIFFPDSGHQYATFNTMLMGGIVSTVAWEKYRLNYYSYIKSKILANLNVPSIQPDYSQYKSYSNRTLGYYDMSMVNNNNQKRLCTSNSVMVNGVQYCEQPVRDISWKLPGGGWMSNIVDLSRWAQALLDGKNLNATSVAAMRQGIRDNNGYTLGQWSTLRSMPYASLKQNRNAWDTWYGHAGDQPHCRSIILYSPRQRFTVSFFTNTFSFDSSQRLPLVFSILKAAGADVN